MIIYIAGRISGDPNYREKFRKAEQHLISQGHTVLNPAWLPTEGLSYGQYMNIGFSMLREAEAIYLLEDWKDSAGAVAEYSAAKIRGMKVICEVSDGGVTV